MRRFVLLCLATLCLLAPAAYAEQIILNNAPPAPTVVNTYRTDFNGSFTPWFVQVVGNKWVWDVIASTDGWAEIDFGPNLAVGTWTIQPIIGSDVCRDPYAGARWCSLIPQVYALHYGTIHAETWAVGIVPFRPADLRIFKLRQIVSRQLGRSKFWVGAHFDAEAVQGAAPVNWVGPIFEREIMPGATASFTDQWNLATHPGDGQQSRFLATVVFTR